jgi:hypothetical protein
VWVSCKHYAILQNRLECPRISVSEGVLEPSLLRYRGMTVCGQNDKPRQEVGGGLSDVVNATLLTRDLWWPRQLLLFMSPSWLTDGRMYPIWV